MRRHAPLLIAVLVTLAGLTRILAPAPSPLGALSYDSFRYLAGAESILRDGKYRDLDGSPQRLWPPGTSLLYAGAAAATGVPAEELVPAVNAMAYVLSAFFLWLLARAAEMRWWTAGLMFVAVLLNSMVLAAHRKLWSEPPVLALLLAMLCCVAAARRDRLLVAATILAAVAIVFRFAMLAAVPLLAGAFVVFAKRKLLAVLPLAAPALSWLVLRLLAAPASGSRASRLAPLPWRENLAAARELASQFFPGGLLGIAALLAILAAAPFLTPLRRERPLAAVAAAWVVCYGAFLLLAQSVASPSFTLDLRILLPLYVGLAIAIAAAADAAPRLAVAGLLALPLLVAPVRAARQILSPQPAAPQQCVAREQFLGAIGAAGVRGPVDTNAAGLVWFATRQPVVRGAPNAVWLDAKNACANVVDDPRPAPAHARVLAPARP